MQLNEISLNNLFTANSLNIYKLEGAMKESTFILIVTEYKGNDFARWPHNKS